MYECCGCDATENLRRMDLSGDIDGIDLEEFLGGPQYICPRCDDDATDLLVEFRAGE